MKTNERLAADSLQMFLSVIVRIRDEWRQKDISEAKRCGEEFEPAQIWYRGVSKANYELRPKLYRKSGFDAVRKYRRDKPDENEIRRGFKSSAVQLITERHLPNDEKGWYFLMQHYGAPTRLLDWTDSALLALYFALRDVRQPRDAAVWVLDPGWLNKDSLEEDSYLSGIMLPEWRETDPWFPTPFEETLHPQTPLALDPPHVARRVSVQRSHFTIHGTDKRGLDNLVGERDSRLVKVTILKAGIINIIDDLQTCGIVETSVFPDLEGLSSELIRLWGGD